MVAGNEVVTVQIGTRPATDALARIDQLARDGKFAQDELDMLIEVAVVGHSSRCWFEIGTDRDGAAIIRPAPWLAEIIERAGARD